MVVDDVVAGAVEFGGQEFFSQCHAHRVGDALAQRAGGGFHAGGDAHLGVTSGFAVQLAEVFQLAHGQVVACQVQQSVNQHGTVAVGQHKAVAVGPMWVARVVAQVFTPQGHSNIGHAHGCAGVTGVGLLNCVHGQRADCVGHWGGVGHGENSGGWVKRGSGKPCILATDLLVTAPLAHQHPAHQLLDSLERNASRWASQNMLKNATL